MAYQGREGHYTGSSNPDRPIMSRRDYSVVVTIIEVFFRKNMGERYFNGRMFFHGLIALLIYRFILSFDFWESNLDREKFSEIQYFDVFIVLYILFSLYHFIRQWRARATRKMSHSYYLGDSRFAFLAQIIPFGNKATITYSFIEPFILFLLIVPVGLYSLFLGLMMIIATFGLWRRNSKIIAQAWQEYLDLHDSQIHAEHIGQEVRIPETQLPIQKSVAAVSKKQKKQKLITPPEEPIKNAPSVEEALKNLNPNLKNLGKKE